MRLDWIKHLYLIMTFITSLDCDFLISYFLTLYSLYMYRYIDDTCDRSINSFVKYIELHHY